MADQVTSLTPLVQPSLEVLGAAHEQTQSAGPETDHPKHVELRKQLIAVTTLHPGAKMLLVADDAR